MQVLDARHAHLTALASDSARIQFSRFTRLTYARHFTWLKHPIIQPSPSCSATPILPYQLWTSHEQIVNKLWTFSSVEKPRYIHYIYKTSRTPRLPCPALLLKKLIVFPYAIIISHPCSFVKHFRNHSLFRIWRIAQIPNVPYIPNVRYVPNVPDDPAAWFFRRRPYIPAPKSWPSALYCVCEKLTAAEEGTLLPPRSKATYILYI